MSAALKFGVLIVGIVVGVGIGAVSYLNRLTALEGRVEVRVRNQIILADVASDDASRARGLGGRASLGVNEGMLFRFDAPDVYPFWMKGMQFPIDIVWIAGNRIVGFEENVPTEPGVADGELKLYAPPAPVDRVLELAAGRVRLLRAAVGDAVQVRPLVRTGYNNGN